MTFKIHYTVGNTEDYIIVSGDSIEDIRRRVDIETSQRGLDQEKNNLWSEEID